MREIRKFSKKSESPFARFIDVELLFGEPCQGHGEPPGAAASDNELAAQTWVYAAFECGQIAAAISFLAVFSNSRRAS